MGIFIPNCCVYVYQDAGEIRNEGAISLQFIHSPREVKWPLIPKKIAFFRSVGKKFPQNQKLDFLQD